MNDRTAVVRTWLMLLVTAALVALAADHGLAAEEDKGSDLARRVSEALGNSSSSERKSAAEDDRETDAGDAESDADADEADAEEASPSSASDAEADTQRERTRQPSPVFRSVAPNISRQPRPDNPDADNADENAPSTADDEDEADTESDTETRERSSERRVLSNRSTTSERRPAQRPTLRDYTIREGDTFSSIAKRLFDDERKWVAIAEANPLIDPAKLKVGQKVKLPDPERYEAERERQLERVAAAVRRQRQAGEEHGSDDIVVVTVAAGDTLSHIARRVYGQATRWRVIFDANRDQLERPNDIQVGMKLRIPPQPSDLN
ncbi:MAG: LysM peptidoglycan-binding domain-containing protein [Phycisphaeraceae bacterium]